METFTPTPTDARRWQDVAKERGFSLRQLGDLLDRTHSTMLAYSIEKRRMPQTLLDRLGKLLGETVQ
jgi:hypothetical protein